jgi:hypothetical protein
MGEESGAMGDDPHQEAARSRTHTKKGLEYQLDIKLAKRLDITNKLSASTTHLRSLLANTADVDLVKDLYTDWLNTYERLLNAHETCQRLLSEKGDAKPDHVDFESMADSFVTFKGHVEEWFSKNYQTSILPTSRTVDNVSNKGSVSSSISSSKIAERQKQAELKARQAVMIERREIEEEKLRLRMKEEEFDIKAELAASEARLKVLEEFTQETPAHTIPKKPVVYMLSDYPPRETAPRD